MKTHEEFSHNKGNVFVQQTTLFSEDRKNNLEGPYKVKKLVNIEDDKKNRYDFFAESSRRKIR